MDLINIGKRFGKIRFQLGLSQIEFAKALSEFNESYPNTDQRKISRIERGEQAVSGKLIHQLREQYDVSGEWLMHGVGEMFGDPPKPAKPPEDDWRLVYLEKRVEELEKLTASQDKLIDHYRSVLEKIAKG